MSLVRLSDWHTPVTSRTTEDTEDTASSQGHLSSDWDWGNSLGNFILVVLILVNLIAGERVPSEVSGGPQHMIARGCLLPLALAWVAPLF